MTARGAAPEPRESGRSTDRSEGGARSRPVETVRSQTDRSGAPEDAGEIAYQGRPGAFGDAAARAVAGEAGRRVPCATFAAVVDALAEGRVRRAVLPVVNVLAGGVGEALDLVIARGEVAVVGAVTVPVALALIAPPGVALGAIRRVRSHPVALAQCRGFFAAHPHLAPVADFDTAGAVEAVLSGGRADEAALASVAAARVYGGAVVRAAVQDHAANATRFLVLARTADAPVVADAPAAVAVWTGADAGLAAVLARLDAAGWRLAHLERRPAAALASLETGTMAPGHFVLDLVRGHPGAPDLDALCAPGGGLVVRGRFGAAHEIRAH